MKYLFFIILLVGVIITAGCMQPGPAKKVTLCDEKYRCNGICYPEVGTCCGGIYYPIDNNIVTTCCGGKMYPFLQGTCCDESWYPKNNTTGETGSGECCPDPKEFYYHPAWRDYEQVWINTNTQHCCGGKVAPGGTGVWKICGDTCYDTSTQSCCFDRSVHEGKSSCCLDQPSPPAGMHCNKDTGSLFTEGQRDPINPLHPFRGY